jgi:hypothetical protein
VWLAFAAPARAQVRDSTAIRFEVGGSGDYTNELYYESFDDTTFNQQRVTTPEARYAGVVLTSIDGTRAGGLTRFGLVNELSLGDLLSRETLSIMWRSDPTLEDRFSVDPRVEFRHDQTLGRDLREWRASGGLRYRRSFVERFQSLQLAATGEFQRSDGAGSDFVLDRNAGTLSAALEQMALDGAEWRAGYRFTTRTFPDSAERDHFEHGWDASLRVDSRAFLWQLETSGERRVTRNLVPTSRDNFWQEWAAVSADWRGESSWSVRMRAGGEAIQYDLQDSTLFFNYQLVNAAVGPRYDASAKWSVWFGPRGEQLFSRIDPGEAYREIAGLAEVEFVAARLWWNVTPIVGWRDYNSDPAAASQGYGSLHSSFAFYELSVLGDQALPGSLRLRAMVNARLEAHEDQTQDATSLYFSLDLRKMF